MNSSIYCLGASTSWSAANHPYFNRIFVLLQAFLISIFCCFFATSAGLGKWMCSTPLSNFADGARESFLKRRIFGRSVKEG